MGNPSIQQGSAAAPPADAGNGMLARVPGDVIARAADTLPPACEGEPALRTVDVELPPEIVRITYRLNSYRRGRSQHWHWLAVRADRADEKTPVACLRRGREGPGET